MTETTAISLWVATLSAALLALLGVDYYALLWGFFGVAFSQLVFAAPMGRKRVAATVLLSTLAGAVCGSIVADHTESRRMLMLSCFISGAGAQPIVSAWIAVFVNRISRAAGRPLDDMPSGPPPAPPGS